MADRTPAARRQALQAYMTTLRDRMRLQAWDIEVKEERASGTDTILNISPNVIRHFASIRVGSFFEETRAEQRQAAVHELVHLVQASLAEFAEEGDAHKALGPAGLGWVLDRVISEMEVQADAVARALAPSMPLPPRWPKG